MTTSFSKSPKSNIETTDFSKAARKSVISRRESAQTRENRQRELAATRMAQLSMARNRITKSQETRWDGLAKSASRVATTALVVLGVSGLGGAVAKDVYDAQTGPDFSQKELADLPAEYHRTVKGAYATGANQFIEDSGIYAKDEIYNEVQEYVHNQIAHSNPLEVDVPDPSTYLLVEEYKQR